MRRLYIGRWYIAWVNWANLSCRGIGQAEPVRKRLENLLELRAEVDQYLNDQIDQMEIERWDTEADQYDDLYPGRVDDGFEFSSLPPEPAPEGYYDPDDPFTEHDYRL